MKVIAHQTVVIKRKAEARAVSVDQVEKDAAVIVIVKDGLAVVAAVDHVKSDSIPKLLGSRQARHDRLPQETLIGLQRIPRSDEVPANWRCFGGKVGG